MIIHYKKMIQYNIILQIIRIQLDIMWEGATYTTDASPSMLLHFYTPINLSQSTFDKNLYKKKKK